ncbi:Protein kinase-like domain protein [Niveomyces insectorum RCEF 264]|uniref:EKC/KEOPS complex subunit BUD32 n=1 Tax=Niveomyces insectorum RCEF 264 TaxID=1081102 RepID=A0A167ZT41_9HYPO|nr:Protein kinase-like domain protein [Niveomyces insectorum RCEF 264]
MPSARQNGHDGESNRGVAGRRDDKAGAKDGEQQHNEQHGEDDGEGNIVEKTKENDATGDDDQTEYLLLDSITDRAYQARLNKAVGLGCHGLIELAPCGTRVTKCARTYGRDAYTRCVKARYLIRELDVYRYLNPHPRILAFYGFTADRDTAFITLEYMKNGDLRRYLEDHPHQTMRQRLLWCAQAAEGPHYLHSQKVIHSDMRTENMLVADDLTLRLIDFGGSAIDGDRALVAEATRYFLPRADWTTTPDTDRFALGSCFYHMMTGHDPHHDVEHDLVDARFAAKVYPDDVHALPVGDVIINCWECKYTTTREVYMDLYNLRDKVASLAG